MTQSNQESREPSHDELESLFVNNVALERIEAYLNRFNPIKIMKMERMEIRHSAILAWLLDPAETHGLGDRFLKAFLGEAFRGHSDKIPTALGISQSDFRDAEVRCEWRKIDIFILSPTNKWAFIIENKFDSKQHKGQLEKYFKDIKAHFKEQKELKIRGVFLTLSDETPEDPQNEYAPIKYESVCEILELILKHHSQLCSPEVTVFLNHYLEILKDATGMSEKLNDMEELAKRLYREHKKVLDFIVEHGASTDFAIAARMHFGDNPDRFAKAVIGKNEYVFCGLGTNIVSFLPMSWYEAFGKQEYKWRGCENWWAEYPLITWLRLTSDKEESKGWLKLVAEVGPSDFRAELIAAIKEIGTKENLNNINFQKGADSEGRKYSKFFKSNSIRIDDIHNSDEIFKKMTDLMNNFQSEFNSIAKVLPQFLERGEH